MARSPIACAFIAVLFSAGCVPVTEPIGGIDKAEPDKTLVGKWDATKGRGQAELFAVSWLRIDAPDVKGNPKGLMRGLMKSETETDMWFFVTKAGKNAYANIILEPKDGGADFWNFKDEGTFAKWKKGEAKRYFIFKYTIDGDTLAIACGREGAFSAIADAAKINKTGTPIGFYETEAGWLEKYLDKNGPDKIFDGTNSLVLKREKK